MQNFKFNPFSEIISDEELDSVVDNYNGLINPLYFLFGEEAKDINDECEKAIISITKESINNIKAINKPFLLSLRNRLLDSISYDGPESSLGEIRAFNSLYSVFGDDVRPRPTLKTKPTSDFELFLRKNKVLVEVNSPQPDVTLNGAGKIKWEKELLKEVGDLSNGKKFTITITSKAPFGREKCKNLYENVIHKLSQIKQGDKQSDPDHYSILWVDLFDKYISIINNTGISKRPLIIKRQKGDKITSTNVLWYSIYGKKGLPIYDSRPKYDGTVATMLHEGKFASKNSSKWDMVIYASPSNTVAYQNPYSTKKAARYLIKKIKKLGRFNKKMSRITTCNKLLKKRIEKDYKYIEKIKTTN